MIDKKNLCARTSDKVNTYTSQLEDLSLPVVWFVEICQEGNFFH